MAAQERRLKAFMYERLYYHPEQIAAAEKARDVVARLFWNENARIFEPRTPRFFCTCSRDKPRLISSDRVCSAVARWAKLADTL